MKQPIWRLALAISFLFSIAMGYWMWHLYEQKALWGHRPLFLFLGLFVFFLLLLGRSLYKEAQRLRWLGFALASGLLLGLAFPPLPLSFLVFIAFVPLLIVEQELSSTQSQSKGRLLFGYLLVSFNLWNIIATYWVANTAFIAGVFAIVANSLLLSIPFLLYHHSRRILSPKLASVAFIVFWITFEYWHMRWELSWSWLTLGNVFARFPSWVQWYEFTGVFGGSLWVLWCNVLIQQVINKKSYASWIVRYSKPILLVSLPIAASLVLYFTHQEHGISKEIVVVQPNYEPHYQKFEILPEEQLKRFIELSQSKLTDSTHYLVFPETSFSQIKRERPTSNKVIRDLQTFVNQYKHLNLVMGISAQKTYASNEPHGPAVRTHLTSRGDTIFWDSSNAAIQISSGKSEMPIYLKSILVPGAENFPYRRYLFFLQPIVDALEGSMGLVTQKERSVFRADDVAIAPVICYESVYGEYETGYIRKGANALFIVTNDGWWSKTAGHRQHLAYARLRAIESRRSIARSANTGISAFINQRGDVLQPTKYNEATAIRGNIQFNDAITFYVRWGDLIGRISMFAAILLLLNAFAKGWLKRAQQKAAKRSG